MIDEIDYFPKRDKFKKKKPVDDGWGELKKLRNAPEEDGPHGFREPPGKVPRGIGVRTTIVQTWFQPG